MTTFTGEKGQEKGKIKEYKGKSENATVAKLVSRLMINKRKKTLWCHRVPGGGALFVP